MDKDEENTFRTRALSYFCMSLWPLRLLLGAKNTYLNSLLFMGSFQNASHVTVLSCLISFHLYYTKSPIKIITSRYRMHLLIVHGYSKDKKVAIYKNEGLVKKAHLQPGIGHSGIGASLPMLITISSGIILVFNFPIYKNINTCMFNSWEQANKNSKPSSTILQTSSNFLIFWHQLSRTRVDQLG